MGGYSSGSLNTTGFSAAINQNRLPSYQHITHSGTYNEQFFEVGTKANELLELYSGVGVSNCQLYGLPNRNYFLSLFMKSSLDGLPRSKNINACIALDISGSMNSQIKHSLQIPTSKTRLQLSRDAIWMFFQKLQPQDIFSLVVFHTQARTVLGSEYKKNLEKDNVRTLIYQNFQSGGTTIRKGFERAIDEVKKNIQNIKNYENRIIIITDVCDNTVADEQRLINQISQGNKINTTIIGVSSDFRSQTCQKLKQVKGFNYFCAVEDSDLQTFLVKRFDYTFFPCVLNIDIRLQAPAFKGISVYGSSDEGDRNYEKGGNFCVSKMKSMFPSQVIYNKVKSDEVLSLGGLVLVKFQPFEQKQLPDINLKILLSYEDLSGQQYCKQYLIKQEILAEEYYSNQAVRAGVQLFYYAESMRSLLKIMGDDYNDAHKNHYIDNLNKLFQYCPEGKKQELKGVIKILEVK